MTSQSTRAIVRTTFLTPLTFSTPWLFDPLTFWSPDFLTPWLFDLLTFWPPDFLIPWLFDPLTFWSPDFLIPWLFDPLTFWPPDFLIPWLFWPYDFLTSRRFVLPDDHPDSSWLPLKCRIHSPHSSITGQREPTPMTSFLKPIDISSKLVNKNGLNHATTHWRWLVTSSCFRGKNQPIRGQQMCLGSIYTT